MSVIEDGEEYMTVNDLEHFERWINDIKSYTGEKSDIATIKFALSYTLQSLRNQENMDRFKWGDKCV